MQHRKQTPKQSLTDDGNNISTYPDASNNNNKNYETSSTMDIATESKRGKRRKSHCIHESLVVWIGVVVVTGIILVVYLTRRHETLTLLPWLRVVTLYPIYLCCYSCCRHMIQGRSMRQPPQQKQRQVPDDTMKKCLLPITLIITVVSAQLPPYIGTAIATMSIIAFSIITRPSPTTSMTTASTVRSKVTFVNVVLSMMFMITVLLVENFLIWVVSATFLPGQLATTAPPPLQDNGQRVLNYVFGTSLSLHKTEVVFLRRLLNTQWALVACVGTSFVLAEVYEKRRTLYGIANRALMTVGIARFIRTISFIVTVVPSQNQFCYTQRGFPYPVPTKWIDWIWIGIIPRSHGGCNDLIVSGHATIISTRT
jgi:hypothetical protein